MGYMYQLQSKIRFCTPVQGNMNHSALCFLNTSVAHVWHVRHSGCTLAYTQAGTLTALCFPRPTDDAKHPGRRPIASCHKQKNPGETKDRSAICPPQNHVPSLATLLRMYQRQFHHQHPQRRQGARIASVRRLFSTATPPHLERSSSFQIQRRLQSLYRLQIVQAKQ